jgi:hypothetical protein
MKKARWCDGGTTFLMEGASTMHARAEENALAVDVGDGMCSLLMGRKLRCRVDTIE